MLVLIVTDEGQIGVGVCQQEAAAAAPGRFEGREERKVLVVVVVRVGRRWGAAQRLPRQWCAAVAPEEGANAGDPGGEAPGGDDEVDKSEDEEESEGGDKGTR